MPKAVQIKESNNIPDALNFVKLRQEGIKHISELAGDLWTDHNEHDPGITILEVLCYALTDLGYRTDFGIKELLARPKQDIRAGIPDDNFFSPAEILTCNPLTIIDYRKLLVDIDGVRNAWLEPATAAEVQLYINCEESKLQSIPANLEKPRPLILNGLYRVFLELEEIRPQDQTQGSCKDGDTTSRVLEEVHRKLHAHRNIGEDFLEVIVLKKQKIGICSDIELEAAADPTEVLTQILETVQLFLSPVLSFYALKDMLQAGLSMDEIFEGRPLSYPSHGFVKTEELEALPRRSEINISDIYREIMKVPGVKGIKNLALLDQLAQKAEEWCFPIRDLHYPSICLDLSNIKFFKGVLPLEADEALAQLISAERLSNFQKVLLDPEKDGDLDSHIPNGTHRPDLGDYYSIQNDFPLVYGIGEDGLSRSETIERKAQAQQLKGYLLFFDQLLASYLVQMSNLRERFALRPHPDSTPTGLSGNLDSIPRVEQLIRFHEDANSDFRPRMLLASMQEAPYNSPELRDAAILEWVKAFEIDQIEIRVDSIGRCHYFIFENKLNRKSLRSSEHYSDEVTALQVAQSLIFLATQIQAYRKQNQQLVAEYSFELIYAPLDYTEFANDILESPTQYAARRDEILNHLLARFSEQFTDYVLLTFALEGKNNRPEKTIADKEAFLAAYPEISRNRGRGYDYTQEKIWNTDNISGLAQRVTHLMGRSDWERSSMGNFEVVEREEEACFYGVYHKMPLQSRVQEREEEEEGGEELEQDSSKQTNHCNLLFKSTKAYPENELDAAFEAFKTAAQISANYQKFDCEIEQKYGFQLVDDTGCVLAEHPATYRKAAIRDEILACTQNWLYGEALPSSGELLTQITYGEDSGWMTRIVSFEQGYYFSIQNAAGDTLFRSPLAFENEDEAWEALINVLPLLQDIANYQNTEDAYGRYGFEIQSEGEVVAIYSKKYISEAERDAAKQSVFEYITGQQLNCKTLQTPTQYQWQWRDEAGTLVLQSAHRFKTQEQAAAAFYLALTEGEIIDETNEAGQFFFEIQKNESLTLATSIPFETEAERRTASMALRDVLYEVLLACDFAFQYELQDENNESLIRSIARFDSKNTALDIAREVLPLACDDNFLRIEKEEDYCIWYVNLYDTEGNLVAQTSDFPNKAAATERAAAIKAAAEALENNLACPRVEGGYAYLSKDAEGNSQKSSQIYPEATAALHAYLQANPDNSALSITSIAGKFYTQLLDKTGEKVWLESLERFATAWEAKRAFYKLIDTIQEVDEDGNYFNIVKTEEEEACCFGFEIQNADKRLAVHPDCYTEEAERDSVLAALLACLVEEQLPLSVDYQNGKYRFEVQWFNCAGLCETLLVGEEHNNESDAKEELKKLRACIEKNTSFFTKIENRNSYSFHIDKIDCKATHPKNYATKEERDKAMEKAKEYINAYKYQQEDNTWKVHAITNPCFVPDSCAETDADIHAYRGFRLKKEGASIAQYVRKFQYENDRENAISELLAQLKAGECLFTEIRAQANCVGSTAFAALVNSRSNEVLWHSPNGLESQAAAQALAQAEAYTWIALGRKPEQYRLQTTEEGKYKLELLNESGTVVAVSPSTYEDASAAKAAEKARLKQSRQYPLVKMASNWTFQLADETGRTKLWKSTASYPNEAVAWNAFREFWTLLHYEGNYTRIDYPEASLFELELGEVLLESKRVYQGSDLNDIQNANDTAEEYAWEAVDTFLTTIQDENSLQYFTNSNCEYGFQIVSNNYTYANFPTQYYSKEAAALVCDYLFEKLNCNIPLYTQATNQHCKQDEVYRYLIRNEEGHNLWRSKSGFVLDDEGSLPNYEDEQLRVLHYAKFEDCYQFVQREKLEKTESGNFERTTYYILQLSDEEGNVLAEAVCGNKATGNKLCYFTAVNDTDAKDAIAERVRHANLYPYVRNEDGSYSFQLSCLEKKELHLEIKDKKGNSQNRTITLASETILKDEELCKTTILESAKAYNSLAAATTAFKQVQTLKCAKANYLLQGDDYCGPFQIQLVDPSEVYATHPSIYAGKSARDAAVERMYACVNVEGLHLVEHILLRPKSVANERCFITGEVKVNKEVQDPASENGKKEYPICFNFSSARAYTEAELTNEDLSSNLKADFLNKLQEAIKDKETSTAEAPQAKETIIKGLTLDIRSIENAEEEWLSFGTSVDCDEATFECALKEILSLDAGCLDLVPEDSGQEAENIFPVCIENACCQLATPQLEPDFSLFDYEQDSYNSYIPNADPYSFWVTLVLPHWPKRFQNIAFRNFFESTLQREIPAHVALSIAWISPKQMRSFERTYRNWLAALNGSGQCEYVSAKNAMIAQIMELENVYPPIRLSEGQVDAETTPAILDFSVLR